MRTFVFYDKTEEETEIIINLLQREKINYKVIKKKIECYVVEEEYDCLITEYCYDIVTLTDLEHYNFIKYLYNKDVKYRLSLEKSYLKRGRRKNVLSISKEDITNSDKKDRSR